ncbi:MAG: tetratricopeptide repeat protein [Clostridiales bacterium]|nr:tetratricopeptide repeat protein [Bacillota bacterium]NLL53719.1 tetratricopeptide repeat protein [Clostridiales bacterium]
MRQWLGHRKKWIRGVSFALVLVLAFLMTSSPLADMAELSRIYDLLSGTIEDPQTGPEYLELANIAIGRKEYKVALKHLEKARQLTDGEDAATLSELWLKSASVQALLGDSEQANSCLAEALALNPESTQALLLRAQLAITAESYEAAVEDLEVYLALAPEDGNTRLTLAQLYEGVGRYADAKDQYQRMADAAEEGGGDAHLLNALRCGFLNGDYEESITGFEAYLAGHPQAAADHRSVAQFLRAACLMQLSRWEEAVDGFRAAMDEGYDPASCMEQMMLCSFDAGNFENTIAFAQEMLDKELAPNSEDVFYQRRGIAMMQTARYEEAVESLTQSIERNANLAGSYYYRGVSLLSLEKYDEAIADFTASIESGFLPQYCYYNRGVCYIQKVEYDEALNDFEKTLTEGDDPDLIQGAKDILWQLAAYYENQAALTETPEMRVADSDAAGQG